MLHAAMIALILFFFALFFGFLEFCDRVVRPRKEVG